MPHTPETRETAHDLGPARRTVLRGVAVGAAASLPLLASPATAEAKPKAPQGKAPKGKPVASTKEVPVGSGKLFQDEQLIVTQPKKGKFEGFHSTCTHANCPVSEIKKGKMICPCHNAEFDLEGKPIKGPARRPLHRQKVTVAKNKIYKG